MPKLQAKTPEENIIATEEEIKIKTDAAAKKIIRDYNIFLAKEDKDIPLVLIVLSNGGMFFGVDLCRAIYLRNAGHRFLSLLVQSYGKKHTSKKVKILHKLPKEDVEGAYVVVIDDICDTQKTEKAVSKFLESYNVKIVKFCFLASRNKLSSEDKKTKYCLFENLKGWLIGMGLDDEGKHRGARKIFTKE